MLNLNLPETKVYQIRFPVSLTQKHKAQKHKESVYGKKSA